MTDTTIKETRSAARGRYVLADADGDSELTYRLDGDRMIIDSTYTPPASRGRGIAGRLVERAVADARARNWRIVPVCPYVRVKIERTPAMQDVLADT
ncbi:MAG: GNAT family N-acetyltransferase [Gammaproteobacteria bacterium]